LEEKGKREKASRTRRYFNTFYMNNSYPPEDDISVMAARTPTAIIAKVNANSFSKIDMGGNALIISVVGCFCKRVKLLMRSIRGGGR